MEDGKERDLNQSGSKMDGPRRAGQKRRKGERGGFDGGGGVGKHAGRGE